MGGLAAVFVLLLASGLGGLDMWLEDTKGGIALRGSPHGTVAADASLGSRGFAQITKDSMQISVLEGRLKSVEKRGNFAHTSSCSSSRFRLYRHCAKADKYDFTIGSNASGFFTTGAASTQDPGYYLLTEIEFTSIHGTDSDNTTFSYTDQVDKSINTGAAYDPATGKFINHENGNTYHDSGIIDTQKIFDFNGLGSGGSYAGIDEGNPDTSEGNNIFDFGDASLSVTPMAPPSVTPEPSSLVLLGTGALGLAGAVRRKLAR